MKYLFYTIAIILLIGIQIGLLPYIQFFTAAPNLLLLMVFVLAIQRDVDELFFVAFVGGLALDVYTGLYLGTFTLTFLFAALALYFAVTEFFVQELSWKYVFTGLLITVVCSSLLEYAYALFVFKAGLTGYPIPFTIVKLHLVPEIIYNSILLYPMYILVQLLKNVVEHFSRQPSHR